MACQDLNKNEACGVYPVDLRLEGHGCESRASRFINCSAASTEVVDHLKVGEY
jgi:hypothetical protein